MVKPRLLTMLWLDIGVCTHFELFCDGIRIWVYNEANGIPDITAFNPDHSTTLLTHPDTTAA